MKKKKKVRELSYTEVESATRGFAPEMLIGKGSHGRVYKAVLPGGKKHVAVKQPSLPAGGGDIDAADARRRLQNEIDILASVHNPHLVNLVGVVNNNNDNNNVLLVMEYMPNGSLHDLLHASESDDEAPPPTWQWRALVAVQIARAIRTLHESNPPVIHRDVKSANILFDDAWNARLADFSLAVRPTTAAVTSPAAAGTIGYLDPGYTAPSKLGPKIDIFSFGVVLLELLSSRPAMDVAAAAESDDRPTSIVAWAAPLIRAGRAAEVLDGRLPLPSRGGRERAAVTRMLGLAARCVYHDEKKRPWIAEVVHELRKIVIDEEHVLLPRFCFFPGRILNFGRCYWHKKITATATRKIVCRDRDDDGGKEESGWRPRNWDGRVERFDSGATELKS